MIEDKEKKITCNRFYNNCGNGHNFYSGNYIF